MHDGDAVAGGGGLGDVDGGLAQTELGEGKADAFGPLLGAPSAGTARFGPAGLLVAGHLEHIAETVGVHETTVSRAIANKYIRTPHGVFPFKYFFTPGYKAGDGESVSNKTIKDMISHIIEEENPAKPFSDQNIVDQLKAKNIKIARRTVAKYREELGILPTNLRRRYE